MDQDFKLKKKERKEREIEFIGWKNIDFICVFIELLAGLCVNFLFYYFVGLKVLASFAKAILTVILLFFKTKSLDIILARGY